MTESRAKTLIAAITSAIYDLDRNEQIIGGRAPASSIYLALGMDIAEYNDITAVMSELGLLDVRPDTVALTAKGRELGRKCSAIYDAAKAAS